MIGQTFRMHGEKQSFHSVYAGEQTEWNICFTLKHIERVFILRPGRG